MEVDDSLGKRWADDASGRCEIEALGVVLVVGRASTTSRVAELDILVRVGVGKGELGETLGDPSGFVFCARKNPRAILLRNCLGCYCVWPLWHPALI